MVTQRKIIHVDMDAFYAAIEQRDNPPLRGKPVVIGGDADSRGVVSTASYEARRYGIHSAMPTSHAKRLCPHAIFLPPRFAAYREASEQIHEILHSITDCVEPIALDEAYLDVTHLTLLQGSATRIAQSIRQHIFAKTHLTASAGVSYNKFLAKLASDLNKPNGLAVILPEQGIDFISRLKIGQFHGIGQQTEIRMRTLGICTGADLLKWSRSQLLAHFGKAGSWYYDLARGVDHRAVEAHRQRKSIGTETTFAQDILSLEQVLTTLEQLSDELIHSLQNKQLCAKTWTVKVKYANFEQVTRSLTLANASDRIDTLKPYIPVLLKRTQAESRAVRLVGISASGLSPKLVKWQQLHFTL